MGDPALSKSIKSTVLNFREVTENIKGAVLNVQEVAENLKVMTSSKEEVAQSYANIRKYDEGSVKGA